MDQIVSRSWLLKTDATLCDMYSNPYLILSLSYDAYRILDTMLDTWIFIILTKFKFKSVLLKNILYQFLKMYKKVKT